jgi:hypothetical protein
MDAAKELNSVNFFSVSLILVLSSVQWDDGKELSSHCTNIFTYEAPVTYMRLEPASQILLGLPYVYSAVNVVVDCVNCVHLKVLVL